MSTQNGIVVGMEKDTVLFVDKHMVVQRRHFGLISFVESALLCLKDTRD